jgi:hypothetical protein
VSSEREKNSCASAQSDPYGAGERRREGRKEEKICREKMIIENQSAKPKTLSSEDLQLIDSYWRSLFRSPHRFPLGGRI